jgi:hypothetical protein
MNTRVIVRLAMLGSAYAIGTFWLGWWSVPVIAILWGLIAAGTPRAVLHSVLAAAIAWTVLLLWTTLSGPLPTIANQLAGATGLHPAVLITVTVIFPAILAWSGTLLGTGVRD